MRWAVRNDRACSQPCGLLRAPGPSTPDAAQSRRVRRREPTSLTPAEFDDGKRHDTLVRLSEGQGYERRLSDSPPSRKEHRERGALRAERSALEKARSGWTLGVEQGATENGEKTSEVHPVEGYAR